MLSIFGYILSQWRIALGRILGFPRANLSQGRPVIYGVSRRQGFDQAQATHPIVDRLVAILKRNQYRPCNIVNSLLGRTYFEFRTEADNLQLGHCDVSKETRLNGIVSSRLKMSLGLHGPGWLQRVAGLFQC